MTTDQQRAELGRLMDLLVRHRSRVHYVQRRPMRTNAIATVPELAAALTSSGVAMDCSESVTLLCRLAGLRDPNGNNYDGSGYTGTLLARLQHYKDPSAARTGALVVFGPGTGDHVAMVRDPGADPVLFSHGSEAGPIYVRHSAEWRAHRPPARFLSIAPLG